MFIFVYLFIQLYKLQTFIYKVNTTLFYIVLYSSKLNASYISCFKPDNVFRRSVRLSGMLLSQPASVEV
jgi:hypothetical protein